MQTHYRTRSGEIYTAQSFRFVFFFSFRMFISTPPTRSYIATAQSVLHLVSSFLLLFCSKFQQLEACTYISNAPTPFFTSRRPRVCCIFFVHSMCISTPPTRSYIATAQRVLHLLSSFLLLFSLARRISSRLVSYCSELRRSLGSKSFWCLLCKFFLLF